MIDPDVIAQLDLNRTEQRLEVSAVVMSAPPRPLRWRLMVQSRGPGGTSNVSQGGTTGGASSERISTTTLSAQSSGIVTLLVFDGEREVASDNLSFGPSGEPTPTASER
ncbi:hypothetical protein MMB232_02792 [Brevundimonas subvibrioides]|uniref:curli-like amyloid fiber formation chaperone CsgH n=1 Tax=Brevundimonas subvibrioides TaxID=74313 RepID=UPI0032D59A17